MIKINRPHRPEYYLSERMLKEESLLQSYFLDKPSQKRIAFNMDVISPLVGEISDYFNNKCAFCETTVYVPVHGNIENFRPRSGSRSEGSFFQDHYWWLAYRWENLYLCCSVCNKIRRDYFPLEDETTRAPINALWEVVALEKIALLDPCIDDPLPHLDFLDNGSVKGLTKRGELTVTIFGLNRNELISERKQAIDWFLHLMEQSSIAGSDITEDFINLVEDLFGSHSKQKHAGALQSAYIRHRPNYPHNDPKANELLSSRKLSINYDSEDADKIERINAFLKDLQIFSIRSVEISNFRNIEHIKLDVVPTNSIDGKESWLLLLGNNGIGKSSILQAIAMTLCGKDMLKKLGVKAADIIRREQKSGYVRIVSNEHDRPYELKFTGKRIISKVDKAPTFLLGYGATRLLPKGRLKESAKLDGMVNVRNLFDYSVALGDVNKWLGKLGRDELETRVFPSLFDLLDLDTGYNLKFENGELLVFDGFDTHRLEAVSDGYKGIIALACDIMKSLSKDIASYHSTQGIVLIDELGNHLHPQWRLKIVSALRKAFPQLQFIVSTHEPLCLRGLAYGEVAVLELVNKKVRVLSGEELPDHSVMKVDQLLTSDLFGLLNTFEKKTQGEYDDYYRLLSVPERDRSQEEKSKIEGYAYRLDGKEMIGATPQIQALYQVLNDSFAKKIEEEGFKTIKEIKKETIEEVKSMIAGNKFDWL